MVASLEAATIPAVILLAARTNEFFAFRDEELLRISTTQTTSVRSRDIKPIIRVDEHIEFDDQLEEEEVIELIGKLRQYRAIDPDLSEQVYIARINEGQRMLLMALYEVTDRQLRSFEEIIAEEFANLRDVNIEPEFENIDTTVEGRVPKEVWNHVRQQLGFPSLEPQISVIQRDSSEDTSTNNNLNLTQKAYLFAAITHRLGLRLPESCLRRLLQVRWDVFMEKIVNEYALRVLIREESEQQIYYQTRHPLIADTITQNLLGRDEQFQVVRQVVAKISYGNLAERYLLYRLLDSERMEELFTPYQRCDLYLQALRESGDDAFLLQHLGIIFMNELQDFEKASQYLEAARALQPENPSIMNSLAILAGKKGLWQLRQGSVIQAKQHYRSAERNFEQQLAIQPASEYGYHPYSYMLFQQAKEMGDEEEQEALLARALGVLDEGLTNVPLENQLALLELESQIINYTERAGIIERLRTLHREELEKSAHKAYLLSRHGLRQDRNRQDIEYLIDRAITHNPSSRSLIRQKVQLLTRFEPSKIKERVELLTMLFHMERRDLWVTRELLYLSFYVGDLALHRQCRQVLSSVLHPDKSVPRMVVDPLSQVPILYSGAIDEVDEFRQYAWIIREPFGDRIYVQPKKNPNIEFVPGQRVRFSVGINFMGAVAKDVEAI